MLAVKQRSPAVEVGASTLPPGERFYNCRHCGDQFKREDHLRRHELSHSRPKFTCLTCGKSFHRNDVLKRHQVVHRQSPQRQKRRPRLVGVQEQALPTTSTGQSSSTAPLSLVTSKRRRPLHGLSIYELPDFLNHYSPLSDSSGSTWSPHGDEDILGSLTLPPSPITTSVSACIDQCREHTLSRVPFLHCTTINYATAPNEILLGLASLGARDIRSETECGLSFFLQAEKTFRTTNTLSPLRKLQCQILLIEFAATTGNIHYRHWAVREQHVAAETVKELLAAPQPKASNVWKTWVRTEELKRTIYALYVLSSTLSALYGISNPLTCNTLEISFPCEDELWNAGTEAEWSQVLLTWVPENRGSFIFPKAVHTVLSGDEVAIAQFAEVGNFGHLILLSGILEAVDVARKSVFNFQDVDDFLNGRVSSFSLKTVFTRALKAWSNLWSKNLQDSWLSYGWAHPHLETWSLQTYMTIEMVDWTQDPQCDEIVGGMTEATFTFVYFSQIGIQSVVDSSPRTLTIVCYSLAKRFAQLTRRWVEKMGEPWSTGHVVATAAFIVVQLQQAAHKIIPTLPNSASRLTHVGPSDMKSPMTELRDQITDIWSYILGSDKWVEDSKGF